MSILPINLTVRCLGALSVLLGLFSAPLSAEESLVNLSAGKLTDATVKTSAAGVVVSAAKENTTAGIKWNSQKADCSAYDQSLLP